MRGHCHGSGQIDSYPERGRSSGLPRGTGYDHRLSIRNLFVAIAIANESKHLQLPRRRRGSDGFRIASPADIQRTTNHKESEQCFVVTVEEALKEETVFKECARSVTGMQHDQNSSSADVSI